MPIIINDLSKIDAVKQNKLIKDFSEILKKYGLEYDDENLHPYPCILKINKGRIFGRIEEITHNVEVGDKDITLHVPKENIEEIMDVLKEFESIHKIDIIIITR